MRFVCYAVGRKLGVGYGFYRVSDGCRLPFQTTYDLDKLYIVNVQYGQCGEDYPVIELLNNSGNPGRWIICQNRKVDYRAEAGGSRSPVGGYGFAQYYFPVFDSGEIPTAWVLQAPAVIARRYGWMSVEQWQRVSEDPDYAYPPLELDIGDAPAPEGVLTLNETRFALFVWKNVWRARNKDEGRFTPVNVLVTPAERADSTLEEGLDFLATQLNRILPEPVKALLTVAVGMPCRAALTFNRSVLRIVYDDHYARSEAECFDFTGGELVLPPSFALSRTEEALAQNMFQGKWPELYSFLKEHIHDARVLGDYNMLLLTHRLEEDLQTTPQDAAGLQAQFERIIEYRALLKRFRLVDDILNDVTASAERRLIAFAADVGWPGNDAQVIAVMVRCIRSSPKDPLWRDYLNLLLKRSASVDDLQLLLKSLYKVPDYGRYSQDHIRFFDCFNTFAERLCCEGKHPDDAALQEMSGLLFKYAKNPTDDDEAYGRYRQHLADLLTGVAKRTNAVGKTILNYLEHYRFPSELLSDIEDVAVSFISSFDWTGWNNERAALSALRTLDDVPTTRKLMEAVSQRVAIMASGAVRLQTLMNFLDIVEADNVPVCMKDVAALLEACNEPMDQPSISRMERYFHALAPFYKAACVHLDHTSNAKIDELLAWADLEDRLPVHDGTVALYIRKSLERPDFTCLREPFETVIWYLRKRLGDDAANDAVLGWYESRGVCEDMARAVLHNAIRQGRGAEIRRGIRIDKLYNDCLWQELSTELDRCGDWNAFNKLPTREQWASPVVFDKAWDFAEQAGLLEASQVDGWFERCLNSEIDRVEADSFRALEGAKALKACLDAPEITYPKLKSAFDIRLKAMARETLFSQGFDETLDSGDGEACKVLYLRLQGYRDSLLDGKAVESVEAYLNAARWVKYLLDAPTREMIVNMDLPYPKAAEKIVPHSRRLLELLIRAARDSHEDKLEDDHPAVYLAALQLARMPVAGQNNNAEVDWNRYRELTGVETEADEVSLIAYTHRLLDTYGRNSIKIYDSFMRYVEKREREGIRQPLPKKMVGTDSMSEWLKNDKKRS